MIRLFTIVGARPQFIKAAAISRAVRLHFSDSISETLIHTGQHYDENMSDVFFREMEIPAPGFHLGVGSGTHGAMTGKMTEAIERILLEQQPNALLVYGDTNSTLAGALAAAKLHIPVVHVEAGLRSFRKTMPEEVNRRLTDHISTFLFSPTGVGVDNLKAEGIMHHDERPLSADNPLVINCGDVMYDNALYFSEKPCDLPVDLMKLDCANTPFVLCTVHRDFNTDDPVRLSAILQALHEVSTRHGMHIILPVHPRTRARMETWIRQHSDHPYIHITDPVSYLQMLFLLKHTRLVMTDSGGLQKEAYFFQKPCVIFRHETEWVEILKTGHAVCTDTDVLRINESADHFLRSATAGFPSLYGNGHASEVILDNIVKYLEA